MFLVAMGERTRTFSAAVKFDCNLLVHILGEVQNVLLLRLFAAIAAVTAAMPAAVTTTATRTSSAATTTTAMVASVAATAATASVSWSIRHGPPVCVCCVGVEKNEDVA